MQRKLVTLTLQPAFPATPTSYWKCWSPRIFTTCPILSCVPASQVEMGCFETLARSNYGAEVWMERWEEQPDFTTNF